MCVAVLFGPDKKKTWEISRTYNDNKKQANTSKQTAQQQIMELNINKTGRRAQTNNTQTQKQNKQTNQTQTSKPIKQQQTKHNKHTRNHTNKTNKQNKHKQARQSNNNKQNTTNTREITQTRHKHANMQTNTTTQRTP